MSQCTPTNVFKNNLDDLIAVYEDKVKQGNLEETESSDINTELDKLYAYRNALKEDDTLFIRSQGEFEEKAESKSDIMRKAFVSKIGGRFFYKEGNKAASKEGVLDYIEPTRDGVKLVMLTSEGKKDYFFDLYAGGRSKNRNNKSTDFIKLENFQEFADEYSINEMNSDKLVSLVGNSDGSFKLGDEFIDDQYVHGNLEDMQNILQKLHLLGGEKATQEELDSHMKVLDKLKPEFFNKLKLYVQEVGEESQGLYNNKNKRNERIDLKISSKNPNKANFQSESSIYLEEVIHSMTLTAMQIDSEESRQLGRQLDNFVEIVRANTTWESYLPPENESVNKAEEEKEARWLYKYIMEGKNSDYEFIAKAIADPRVKKVFEKIRVKERKEKKTVLDYIIGFFDSVIDIITGSVTLKQKNQNVQEALMGLAMSFGELNNKKAKELKNKKNFLTLIFDLLNNTDQKTSNAIEGLKNKVISEEAVSKRPEAAREGLYGRVKDVAETIAMSFVNSNYRKSMGLVASAYGLKSNSTVREIIGGLFETEGVQKIAEMLGMQAGYIDKERNTQGDIITASVLSKFSVNANITDDLEEAMSEVLLDTDLSGLMGKQSVAKKAGFSKVVFNNETIRKLLTDSEFLEKQIRNAKRTLKSLDESRYSWNRDQAVGLGNYLATHQGTPEQNLNALNIVKGIHSSKSITPRQTVVDAVDELSTLVAIQKTDMTQKTKVAELMVKEYRGVQHVADVIEGFKRNSNKAVFKGKKTNKIKGYSREIFDSSIMIEVAPLEDRKLMEDQGFEFKTTLSPRAGDSRNKPMALYVTSSLGRPERLRGSVRMNQVTSKGQLISDLGYKDGEGFTSQVIRERNKRDIVKIKREAMKKAKLMEEGKYVFGQSPYGVMAVTDDNGEVVDYRYMMDKATKKKLLKQNTKISEVMGKSYSNLIDKEKSAEHNEIVLESIKKDIDDNWQSGSLGKDGNTEYTLIGPKVADKELRNLYFMMPKSFQDYAGSLENGNLPIRSDLLELYFGYTHLSILDFPYLKSITPKVVQQVIKFAESLWLDIIKIVKTNILLKIPTVMISNIISNMIYSAMRGYNPLTVLSLYKESYRDIKAHDQNRIDLQQLNNRLVELEEIERKENFSSTRMEEVKREKVKVLGQIKAIKIRIERSPIEELVRMGLDQNVEDITNETDSNTITEFFDNKLEPLPEVVKVGIDYLFLTKKTVFYKVANEFLEKSDLIARDVQNRLEKRKEEEQARNKANLPNWWLADKDSKYPKRKMLTGSELIAFKEQAKNRRQYDLVEDFINYTKPSSRFEEYLNRIGILMFTKYVKRIQRIILKNSGDHPIKTLLGIFAIGYLGGLPSIHEQSFLVKDWYGDSLGAGNVFPLYAPTEHFLNFATPSLLKDSTTDFLP